MSCMILQINAEQLVIPHWIKNNAKWWYQNQIQDSDFIKGIQYLMENKIMIIPPSANGATQNKIPSWVKNDAGWWANGTISDNDFVSGIQYLVSSGIISIKSNSNVTQTSMNLTQSNQTQECDQYSTPAEKETCLEQLQYDEKIKNYMQTATPTVIGPVTFYYINSESQKSDDGNTILTIHFVVENNSNQEVTMTCQRPDSCNYSLSDGQNEIQYSTNTLVYGSLTLIPHIPKLLDWTFISSIDSTKNYSFLVQERWGSGSIPINIH
ncbi:MAG: hypothetical protein WA833_09540 [Nitrosotalea sp.]